MRREGEEVHVDTDEARSGSTPGIVRYVLIISLVLAILFLSITWITGALVSDQASGEEDLVITTDQELEPGS